MKRCAWLLNCASSPADEHALPEVDVRGLPGTGGKSVCGRTASITEISFVAQNCFTGLKHPSFVFVNGIRNPIYVFRNAFRSDGPPARRSFVQQCHVDCSELFGHIFLSSSTRVRPNANAEAPRRANPDTPPQTPGKPPYPAAPHAPDTTPATVNRSAASPAAAPSAAPRSPHR